MTGGLAAAAELQQIWVWCVALPRCLTAASFRIASAPRKPRISRFAPSKRAASFRNQHGTKRIPACMASSGCAAFFPCVACLPCPAPSCTNRTSPRPPLPGAVRREPAPARGGRGLPPGGAAPRQVGGAGGGDRRPWPVRRLQQVRPPPGARGCRQGWAARVRQVVWAARGPSTPGAAGLHACSPAACLAAASARQPLLRGHVPLSRRARSCAAKWLPVKACSNPSHSAWCACSAEHARPRSPPAAL